MAGLRLGEVCALVAVVGELFELLFLTLGDEFASIVLMRDEFKSSAFLRDEFESSAFLSDEFESFE